MLPKSITLHAPIRVAMSIPNQTGLSPQVDMVGVAHNGRAETTGGEGGRVEHWGVA
jgi:hypothetical protein